ncbi:DUF5615 family PIN-like protein [Sorangium sp. So ce321]|uniref:DUF5615 family PIN-like protein n=1 Tax=Sorangium sp. So ce321 TaxID=3133300 RepID=UPI003F5FF96F
MRIKLDENLPTSLVQALVQLGHDADSVQQEGLQGSPDAGVWAAAQVDDGVVTPVPWPEARRRILAAANGRREAP